MTKIKMFAEGWGVYPWARGSPEPTWRSVYQVGSEGEPLVLGYTAQPSANSLVF